MIEFLKALLMWLAAFIPAMAIGSAVSRGNPKRAAVLIQVSMLLLSLPLLWAVNGPKSSGLLLNLSYLPRAFLVGFTVSLTLNAIGPSTETADEPEFLPRDWRRYPLILLLAPLSEELLHRGLVEGYLLSYGHFWSAILFAALLFALPHWRAFGGSALDRISIVAGAFLLGTLVGYFFALGGIVPAFALHASANLAGLVVLHFRER
ncbi:CPBP family intramembrane glutamic endopeptidase [Thermococcus henrietii]|uniref:CPBP family intramembrane glutamic endopeptidase n=1 Tax=Thermococcus henrietii TaxID=2016361 RepID=UPI000C073C42|nr:CPBP family intramembrane glutamic endopeptidase [Thermococcus henrietii]